MNIISDVNWSLGNKDKNQTQLDVHYGIENPVSTQQRLGVKERNKMANLKEEANNYIPPTTLNISELEKVPVDVELFDKTVNEGSADEFSYRFIKANEKEYRVPTTVLKQLKAHLEANPDLKNFSVSRHGEGMKTEYTVIPIAD